MKVFGPKDERSAMQLLQCERASDEDTLSVLCADHHPGYSMPIGGVIALQDSIIPAGVGFDIACGNCAVQTNLYSKDVDIPRVMDEIWRVISFGMGQKNDEKIKDHPVYESISNSPIRGQRSLIQLAQNQLGTVGGGNHYVDLFSDREDDSLWIGVHFGSRGFGHKTASGFLAIAAGKEFGDHVKEGEMDSPPLLLKNEAMIDYLEAMSIAGDYAYAGRNWVCDRILRILGATEVQRIHNHHNFAWFEKHGDQEYWVIRKGATPAWPGEKGFVGGTMAEDAVILEGIDSPESAEALYSTVHGAGRVMSRTAAAGKTKSTTVFRCKDCVANYALGDYQKREPGAPPHRCRNCGGELYKFRTEKRIKDGLINWPEVQKEVKAKGITLRGAGADEAPGAYKRLPEVLGFHKNTIKILHTLRPVGVAMAGADEIDLYKD